MASSVNQWMQSSVTLSAGQCLITVGLALLLSKNRLAEVLAGRLDGALGQTGTVINEAVDLVKAAGKQVMSDSSVIATAAVVAYFMHPAASYFNMPLPKDSVWKMTQFVAATFFVKSALTRIFNEVIEDSGRNTSEENLRKVTMEYLCPVALTVLAARYFDPKFEIRETVAYTAVIYGVVKLLGKGFKYASDYQSYLNKLKALIWKNENVNNQGKNLVDSSEPPVAVYGYVAPAYGQG